MSGKSPLDKRDSPFGQFTLDKRTIASRTSYATAVIFHYKKQNFGIPTNTKTPIQITQIEEAKIVTVERLVLEEEITAMKIQKSVSQASGTFSLSLMPSQNWKAKVSPGDWVMLYIHDRYGLKAKFEDGFQDTKNLVMLANVDRVARSLEKDEETDKVMNRYVVSGRSFGKVFEDTDIWFDPHAIQEETLNKVALTAAGMELQGSPATMMNSLLDVFLGKGADLAQGRLPDLRNWQIPFALSSAFAKTDASLTGLPTNYAPRFNDILAREIDEDLPGFKARQMLTLKSNGSLYNLMERSANDLINSLYFEDVRATNGSVNPTVVLKPRPYNTPFLESHFGKFPNEKTKSLAAIKNKYTTMQQLAKTNFVEISQAEIKYEDMGKDDHSRMNLFWLQTSLNVENVLVNVSNFNKDKGIANPLLIKASIERHGVKRFDQTLEFCYTAGTNKDAFQGVSPNIELYQGFMAQLYDMHFANHLYDAGTIQTTGVLEAELGKALVVLPDPANKTALPKCYYIEGYEHNWSFPHHWTTSFTLTHGQFKVASGQHIFIDAATDDFGQPDTQIDLAYLAKSEVKK